MKKRPAGNVALVGAGPGDPGLLTRRGARLLAMADVVLYDRLVDSRLLALALRAGRKIYVGKDAPGKRTRDAQQKQINALMIRLAREGNRVVRLKGGDPFIFGRGGEEGLELAAAGIEFEVVPGVTAALGAAATTGIPFTHRGIAAEVTFATAHEAEGAAPPPWEALGKLRGTIVFYMGTYTLAHAAEKLIAAGRPEGTPAAVIERATTPAQRTIVGTLATIARLAIEAGVRPPSLVVVGGVVNLRSPLDWFEKRPLFGKRILNTRPADETLNFILEDLGAAVASLPCLAFAAAPRKPLDRAIRAVAKADWAVFTSPRGAMYTMDRAKALRLDARLFGHAKIAAVGPATAGLLASSGLRPDFVPRQNDGEHLARELGARRVRGRRVTLFRGDSAGDALPAALRSLGARVTDAVAYRSVAPRPDADLVRDLAEGRFHAAILSSGDGARRLHGWLGAKPWPAGTKLVTIGPVTSEAVRALGWRVDGEAAGPSRLAEALQEALP